MPRRGSGTRTSTVLIANPSADVYGSDLQMLESVRALVAAGRDVIILVPEDGPLVEQLRSAGATVEFFGFPVLRRSSASPLGLARLAATAAVSVVAQWRLLRRRRPAVVYVNTVTLPWWLLAAKLARVPSLCHVHEAEVKDSPRVRQALAAPLRLATLVVANSETTLGVISEDAPGIRQKATVIHNGVLEPIGTPRPPAESIDPFNLVVVGRLSPRKAPDVALEATALLRRQGLNVRIEICGSTFPGYEWFEQEIRDRAARPDLNGAVEFAGYVNPTWGALDKAHVVLAPSLGESLGNAVIEAQLALRPVVATALQGHLETVDDRRTGLLVPPRDPAAMADAVRELLEDRELAGRLARSGRENALLKFTLPRYHRQIADAIDRLATS